MLSAEQTEMLTRVGKGTPMGEVLRRYWTPILLSEELPEPDCPPVRVLIFGEELVAFRDNARPRGPARRVLRASPDQPLLRTKRGERVAVHLPRLEVRCHRRLRRHAHRDGRQQFQKQGAADGLPGGGQGRPDMGLPWPKGRAGPRTAPLRFMDVPKENRLHTKYLRECNFAQAIDGGIDSVHTISSTSGSTATGVRSPTTSARRGRTTSTSSTAPSTPRRSS